MGELTRGAMAKGASVGNSWDDQTAGVRGETQSGFHSGDPVGDLEAEFRLVLGDLGPEDLAAKLVAVAREYWRIKDEECVREVAGEAASARDVNRLVSEKMGYVSAELIASENIPLDVRALAMATGTAASVGLGSGAAVARDLGISKAAVSKRANQWADGLGYRVTKFMRSERNRVNCATAQKKDHHRNRL